VPTSKAYMCFPCAQQQRLLIIMMRRPVIRFPAAPALQLPSAPVFISPSSFISLIIATFFFLEFASASLSPCSELSSSYAEQLRILNLPAAAAEAAAVHATIECQSAGDSRQFFTRCYSLLYRWCSGRSNDDATSACGADWRLVAGLHRVDSLQALLQHAGRQQQRVLQASGSSGPTRALIYKPSARGEGWGNRVMALTAAYTAALLSRRSFHMLFDADDPVLSSIDFHKFPSSTLLAPPTVQRSFPCLSRAAAVEDPPLNFVRPDKLRQGESVSWVRSVVVSGHNDEVAWLGSLDELRIGKRLCPRTSVLYVSGAAALHHSRDSALRSTDDDHGGVWGSASVVIYSSYDSFWGALLERPATGMLLTRLLLPASFDAAAQINWSSAHLRAWLAFGAFASAVIAPSQRVAELEFEGSASLPADAGAQSPHCARIPCAQCLGVAVRRGRPWNSDWVIIDGAGEADMLDCALAWLRNASQHAPRSAACAFVAADDADVLQRWIALLSREGARVVYTPGSDGSHTGTQHRARAGSPPTRSVHLSYRDWFGLACCSKDALLSDKSSFGYSAAALAVQRWLLDGAWHDATPLMLSLPPAQACERQLWQGHVCPSPPPRQSEMIPC
jgi:hypothetical protein